MGTRQRWGRVLDSRWLRWLWEPRTGDPYTPRMLRVVCFVPLFLVAVLLAFAHAYRFMLGEDFAVWPFPVFAPEIEDPADVLRNTLGAVGLLGAALTGVYAYRKQRLAEGDARRADARQELEKSADARADAIEFSRRYGEALTQMGTTEAAAIRLGGAYAMARLADDWPDQRQTCIAVLCAYLRMPFHPDPQSPNHREGENEVRITIQRIIQAHLKPKGGKEQPSWSDHDFDFTGAHLQSASFSGARFGGNARFVGVTFRGNAEVRRGDVRRGREVRRCDVPPERDVRLGGGLRRRKVR